MKFPKKSTSTILGIFTITALCIIFVSAERENIVEANKQLEMDPNNAIQHFQEVKIIATGNNDNSSATISKSGSGTIRIDTEYNFVLTKSIDTGDFNNGNIDDGATDEENNETEKTCDINNDGEIDNDDIQMLSNIILEKNGDVEKYDFNNDGEISIYDISICIPQVKEERKICDIDGDGVIDTGDIIKIKSIIGGPYDEWADTDRDGEISVQDGNVCVEVLLLGQNNNEIENQSNDQSSEGENGSNNQDSESTNGSGNYIKKGVKGSSILGGFGNRILKGTNETILGGRSNKINSGESNSILGGKNNIIKNGENSVIFGGKSNVISGVVYGKNSSIIGGLENIVTMSDSSIVGNHNTIDGQNSLAMGSNAKISGRYSFLWSDNKKSKLSNDNIFSIIGDNGMIINTTKAHNFSKLTISGGLIIYDDKNAPECTGETAGVLKVMDGDEYNSEQKCFCSCNGSGRNALHEGTRCSSLCAYGTGLQAECGGIKIDCNNNSYLYTGDDTSGACIKGSLAKGTGAFFVTTNKSGNIATDYINRSCQTSDGNITQCMQELTESCPNTQPYECVRDHEEAILQTIPNPEKPKDSATFWKYDPELKGPCTYKCSEEYTDGWDPVKGKCIVHYCTGELSEGAKLNNEIALPREDNIPYFYSKTSTGACAYSCKTESGYHYDASKGKCVSNACNLSNTEVKDLEIFILGNTGNISHYTMMDRNMGASEIFNQNFSSPNKESYGCYFQRGNNYGFNRGRSESSYTQKTLTDPENYGPDRINGYYYNSSRYCLSGGKDLMYPMCNEPTSTPCSAWLWGGAADYYGEIRYGGNGTDEKRQGPCPEGYHIPRGTEMNNIIDEWKKVSNYPNEKEDKNICLQKSGECLQKSKDFASDLLLPFAGYNDVNCIGNNQYQGGGTIGQYLISDYYRLLNYFYIGKSSAGNGIRFYLNGPAHGFSMRCVKNDISADQKITINANGGIKAVITIDWETPENGKITALGTPIKTGYSFGGWYLDPSFMSGVNLGDYISNNSNLYAKWKYKDCDMEQTAIQDLELFFISSIGDISHYMIMDRNMGAYEVYNQKINAELNDRSNGCHFQWGNNYGFTLNPKTTTGQIDPRNYGISSYHSDQFFCYNSNDKETNPYSPMTFQLWGGGYISNNGSYDYGINGNEQDRRGPCPVGYHVPGGVEMKNLVNNWDDASLSQKADGKKFASDLLIPFVNHIETVCGKQNNFVQGGGLWLSDHIYYIRAGWENGGTYANNLVVSNEKDYVHFYHNGPAHGFPVRCVKNNMTTSPQKVTIHVDGGTGAVIAIDWETEGSGKITTLGTPTKNETKFLGWYSDELFTTRVRTGDIIPNGSHLYAKWYECKIDETKVQDLEVYLLSNIGTISHYTMMDRNLGAKEIFNQNFSSPNKESYGCYFQWGNIYPFPKDNGTLSYTNETLTDPENYGPNNPKGYYSNDKKYCNYDDTTGRMYPHYYDALERNLWLWGGGLTNSSAKFTVGSDGTDIDRRGPCPTGYHIPRGREIENILNKWKDSYSSSGYGATESTKFAGNLLLPFAGTNNVYCPGGKNPTYVGGGSHGKYAISDYWKRDNHLHVGSNDKLGNGIYLTLNGSAHGFSIRCVKNDISANPKITINANGGTNAVITIDWETNDDGKIISLSNPKKDNSIFLGRYSDESLTNRVKIGDIISNGSNLYAGWES